MKKRQRGEEKLNQRPVVVSFTSYPKRINKVWIVVETLLRQTVKPNAIFLWLSKEQFLTKEDLPKRLLRLQKRGLRIELRDGDLRSHKKYYYIKKEYPKCDFITVDDDIFYPSTLVENLLKFHLEYPKAIICSYAYRMSYDENSNLLPYQMWNRAMRFNIGHDLFFGSGGGTLFPFDSLSDMVTRKDIFSSLTPLADDVWLNAMCRLVKTPIVVTGLNSDILPILTHGDTPLFDSNIEGKGNDNQIRAINQYFRKAEDIYNLF
jgi:hypothetical protein